MHRPNRKYRIFLTRSFVCTLALRSAAIAVCVALAIAAQGQTLTGGHPQGPLPGSPPDPGFASSVDLPDAPGFPSVPVVVASLSSADPDISDDAPAKKPKKPKQKVDSDITIEGMVSYGNWQIFAAGIDSRLYNAGVEYDKHIWGHVIGSRIDYVAEFLPFLLLNQPAVTDLYGNPRSKNRKLVPGIGFSPIGSRFLWRSTKRIKPFFTVKGGAVGFTQKALSRGASYYDFSIAESIGVYARLSDRWDLRLGFFGDFHFSNGYATSYNPGLDVMNSQLGLTYRFKK